MSKLSKILFAVVLHDVAADFMKPADAEAEENVEAADAELRKLDIRKNAMGYCCEDPQGKEGAPAAMCPSSHIGSSSRYWTKTSLSSSKSSDRTICRVRSAGCGHIYGFQYSCSISAGKCKVNSRMLSQTKEFNPADSMMPADAEAEESDSEADEADAEAEEADAGAETSVEATDAELRKLGIRKNAMGYCCEDPQGKEGAPAAMCPSWWIGSSDRHWTKTSLSSSKSSDRTICTVRSAGCGYIYGFQYSCSIRSGKCKVN